jgi:hypothetical protein
MSSNEEGEVVPIINAERDLIAEKWIDVEITTFSIFNKRCYFIHISS